MAERTLIVEQPAPGVVLVRLNRPDRLNALDAELMSGLEELWPRLRQRADVRCVVLTGNGRGFCSGADAGFLADDRAPRGAGLDGELSFVPGRILDVPVVVAVNGVCAGGGLHFVADADIVIAAEGATFLDPHVSVGQVSGIEPPSLVLRLPLPVISRMALMGRHERLTARRLYDLGLVTELVGEDSLVDRAVEIAAVVASASPAAVRATRRSWRRLSDALVEPPMREGWDEVQRHWAHPDADEGPAALRDKRPPRWSD
ncbi:enoyl-CoA hydratase/isomerase family protein [Phytohabitans kaempferiae]|uniref:Enoyl-CoA hydratase/isomerase family protein n=1 Tax=Phytohabitans kaempferiae TaxID=1620943 RepID=A0ABV6M5L5_9ACTN